MLTNHQKAIVREVERVLEGAPEMPSYIDLMNLVTLCATDMRTADRVERQRGIRAQTLIEPLREYFTQ